MDNQNQNKTSLGIKENIEALLCYVLGWLSGLFFLAFEKENNFVKFHAMQSVITFMGVYAVIIIVRYVHFSKGIYYCLGSLQCILWIFLMYKAYKGEKCKLPIIGDIAEQQINKFY